MRKRTRRRRALISVLMLYLTGFLLVVGFVIFRAEFPIDESARSPEPLITSELPATTWIEQLKTDSAPLFKPSSPPAHPVPKFDDLPH